MICPSCKKEIGKDEIGYEQEANVLYNLTVIEDNKREPYLAYEVDEMESNDSGMFYHKVDSCLKDLPLNEAEIMAIMEGK